jgi:hypothetical protein
MAKKQTVTFTNKELQMSFLDLLIDTVIEIGSASAAHEWLMPYYAAASLYTPYFPPLDHLMNALEIIDEGDYEGMSSTDKGLAVKIQKRLAAQELIARESLSETA